MSKSFIINVIFLFYNDIFYVCVKSTGAGVIVSGRHVSFDLRLWKWHIGGPVPRLIPASNLSKLAVWAFLLFINGGLIEKASGPLTYS